MPIIIITVVEDRPYNVRKILSPSCSLPLLAKTITHPAAQCLCDSWASCYCLLVGLLGLFRVLARTEPVNVHLYATLLSGLVEVVTACLSAISATTRWCQSSGRIWYLHASKCILYVNKLLLRKVLFLHNYHTVSPA